MSEILGVDGLTVRLPNGAAVVDGVSFALRRGETFALLGESGCGKSVTALSLMRLLPDGVRVAGGAVRLGDSDVLTLPEREMCAVRGGRLAMIFQEPGLSLNPVLTVGRQIAEVLELHGGDQASVQAETVEAGGCSRARLDQSGEVGIEVEQRCIELLTQVGIPDAPRRIHEYPFQLSGGMKQRVMIAMALAGAPGVLIADEPTTALDVTIQAQVLQLLRDTQAESGMAMLLITHDLGVVAEMAHQVAVMYAGQIVERASRQQLFTQPLHPYTRKLFAALPDARRGAAPLEAIPGNVPTPDAMPPGCRFAPRCDRAWALCHERAPEWREVDGQGVRCHLYAPEGAGREQGEAAGAAEPGFYPAPDSRSHTLLEVSNLQVHFPIRRGVLQRQVGVVRAVDGVSLEIGAGRTLALVGESGCGKTTAGKAMLQLIAPTAGSVRFGGQELIGLSAQALRAQRAGMQMVFQDPYASLNPRMRVAEILDEGMAALGVGGDSAARQGLMDALMEQVGLSAAAKWRYPHEFSGGQRQRIAIARALAVNPQLLICDEPTSALDVSVQAQILNLLRALQQELELSYLFITHNLAVVEYLAHEVCVMYLGRIVERGATAEVLGAPRHPYTQALLSAVPRVDGGSGQVIRLAGEMPSPAHPPQGCHFHPRCPQAMTICRETYPGETALGGTQRVHCHLYAESVGRAGD
ncbi:ABC transporter ATP-binding protein [Ferriphaselus sp. R-1]|uniref:ABC transporter ATP-binding protein n=1 Tax=Ferriphaselus sp. R-1 TaxID=1485544 RepID=UPI0005543C61|nr:ABC transporter ATP-binding protein [Ferriphaselus sp. R-1]